jgi:uncharacterized membrane protein YeaQ/YmgE (transglycosylase-associated protein family)
MIGALILGFVAGVIGRMLMPGDVFAGMSGPKSWGISLLLGLAGAALGWVIFTWLLGIGDDDVFDLGGILSAIIGVLILLPIAGFVMRRSGTAPPR